MLLLSRAHGNVRTTVCETGCWVWRETRRPCHGGQCGPGAARPHPAAAGGPETLLRAGGRLSLERAVLRPAVAGWPIVGPWPPRHGQRGLRSVVLCPVNGEEPSSLGSVGPSFVPQVRVTVWTHPEILMKGKTYVGPAFAGIYRGSGRDRFKHMTLQVTAAVTSREEQWRAAILETFLHH